MAGAYRAGARGDVFKVTPESGSENNNLYKTNRTKAKTCGQAVIRV